MAKETSDFDQWLERVRASTDALPLVPVLDRIAELAHEAFGARIWFAEILGRRWSHIAGRAGDGPSESETCWTTLTADIGLVWDTWGSLSQVDDRAELIAYLRRLISSRPPVAEGRNK